MASNSHLHPDEVKRQLESNTIEVFKTLDREMHERYKRDTDEDCARALHVAHLLLSYAELPLYFRCRALLILACSREPGYVEYAEEAVRFAELAMAGNANPGEIETRLLNNCKAELEDAKKDAATEAEGDTGSGEEAGQEDEAGDGKEGKEGELVWSSDWETKEEAGVAEPPAVQGSGNEIRKKKKRTRRIHSGDTEQEPDFFEEFDKQRNAWVPLGTALEADYIDETAEES